MIKIYINNKEIFIPANTTVIEACNSIGIEIPRFCFHQRLSVAGNCRMCLVEIEKAPKPIAACTFPVSSSMRIFTETPLVKKARENVLEFLLVNHPLDCPICDQGGECDLQDQALFFGNDKSRFFENKRSVDDKNCGPLIKTIMTRCIHCTRCVRFMTDIAGVEDFGTTNRGRETEIGTYVSKAIETELAGNLIDLCPVGALTAKSYAFTARPWELRSVETVDLSDALGSNIRVDFKESEIMRILPKLNEKINEEWISDKARFNFDALKVQRIANAFSRNEKGLLMAVSWEYALLTLKKYLARSKGSTNIMLSANLDLSTLEKLKRLANLLGIKKVGLYKKCLVNPDLFENFSLSFSLDKLSFVDFCLIVGCNPRYDASAFNLKLRRRFKVGLFKIASLGVPFNLSYKSFFFGIAPATLVNVGEGKLSICKGLRISKNPLFILGGNASERYDFLGIENTLKYARNHAIVLESKRNSPCLLTQEANQCGGFFLGLNNASFIKKEETLLFCGNPKKEETFNKEQKNQILFLGTHGEESLLNANLILPIKGFLENDGFFMNALGRVQKAEKLSEGPNLVRECFKVLESAYLTGDYFFSKKPPVPLIFEKKKAQECNSSDMLFIKKRKIGASTLSRSPFQPNSTEFYLSGALSKFSLTMAKCSIVYRTRYTNFFIAQ